jgi:hypothetical protein
MLYNPTRALVGEGPACWRGCEQRLVELHACLGRVAELALILLEVASAEVHL